MKTILIIHGPNLNLLGKREPEVYGSMTLDELNQMMKEKGEGHNLEFFQSNHEGEIIDRLHEAREKADGVIINPGAYTHYSYAIRDAIASIEVPTIEVHLSDINKREEFRKISVIKEVCLKQISGLGADSYLQALNILLK